MALTEKDLEVIGEMIARGREVPAHCTAEYPHEGKLRYARGNPGVYTCECGMLYKKDGAGGLEVYQRKAAA